VTVTAAAAGNPDHLIEKVAAGALRLSPGEMDRLQSLRSPAHGRRQAEGS